MDLSHPREYAGDEEEDFRRWFTPLIDLKKHIKKRVLILGIIVEFGIPYKSNGTDYCVNVKIVDKSQQHPELSVNIFSDRFDKLPDIKGGRDIILLHQVKIGKFRGEVYATFDKAFSSFALFDGKGDSGTSPYQMHHNFFLHDPWRRLVVSLRKWSSGFQIDAGNTDYLVPLKDIKEEFIDLVGMVCGAHELPHNAWVIWLWDGSDVPPLSLNAALEEEIPTYPVPENIRGKFPVLGTVFQLLVDGAHAKVVRHFHKINEWVKIRNLRCQKAASGVWVGTFTNTSKIRLLTGDVDAVKKCIREFTTRVLKEQFEPMSSWHISHFLTVTKHKSRLSTLVFLLTRAQHKTKLNCIVRVLAVHPSKHTDFQSPFGIHKLRMTLEDPTARLHALLCPEDVVGDVANATSGSVHKISPDSVGIALLFPKLYTEVVKVSFSKLEEEMFLGENQEVDVLAGKMHDLLGMAEDGGSRRNPPWIKCCIEVHVPEDDASGERVFRICHTTLV